MKNRAWLGLILSCCLSSIAVAEETPCNDLPQICSFISKHGALRNNAAALNTTISLSEQHNINTSVKNISDKPQAIIVWTQQNWSWISDKDEVIFNISALSNADSLIILKPGQEFKGSFHIDILPHDKPIKFRMGFYPHARSPVVGLMTKPRDDEFSWSNAITVK